MAKTNDRSVLVIVQENNRTTIYQSKVHIDSYLILVGLSVIQDRLRPGDMSEIYEAVMRQVHGFNKVDQKSFYVDSSHVFLFSFGIME